MRDYHRASSCVSAIVLMIVMISPMVHAVDTTKNARQINRMLIVAVDHRNIRAVKRLLQLGADPNCRDRYGMRALTVSLYDGVSGIQLLQFPFYSHSHEIANVLLTRGADVNGRDTDGRTPLMRMSELGAPNEVASILGKGAKANAVDSSGSSALHWAAMNYSFVPQENDGLRQKRLTAACRVIDMLVSHGLNVNDTNKDGGTPLMYASLLGNSGVVNYLLGLGADVSRNSNSGETALTMAIRAISYGTVFDLLRAGADPNQATSAVRPPLFWAISMQQPRLVKLLLKFGADPNRRFATKGKTVSAVDFAEQLHLGNMVPLLQEPGSR